MKLHNEKASIYIPDGAPEAGALARTTHLGIGAHHDDLEFMAFHGIRTCHGRTDRWFGGITCTDGAGSARTGAYAGYTNEQMMDVRREEQNEAARIGRYAFVAQLAYPSSAVKQPGSGVADDVHRILLATRPEVVYTHNPADKHDTHLAAAVAALEAVRRLPPGDRPKQMLGCEVWRDLDWLPDESKMVLDVGGADDLAAKLGRVFASQIEGGKRYDLAVEGRSRANATFLESHATDTLEKAWFAMDLTPLVQDDTRDLVEYTLSYIDRFRADVERRLRVRLGR